MIKKSLLKQLIGIVIITGLIIYVSLGLILPKSLLPIYEENIYEYLNRSLAYSEDINSLDESVVYVYVDKENNMLYSKNFETIIEMEPKQILSYIEEKYGKFVFKNTTYYYNTFSNEENMKIAIMDNSYVKVITNDIFSSLFPILFITLSLIALMMVFWSRRLVRRIEYLKQKIDNLGNYKYEDKKICKLNDEFKILSDAIDDMKETLKEQDEYKSQMYQSISHDLKTPITVIKSYLEAIDDGVLDAKEAKGIIDIQTRRLDEKVHSLLYLNKLNYIKDSNSYKNEKVNIQEIIDESINKFKLQRKDLKYSVSVSDNVIFNGTVDMWEAIVDNILSNFMRYAEKEIRIIVKNKSIQFYNDGENIDENILDDIFTPYKKGIKGEFGLGLSIVKKTVLLFGYRISVRNEKKGVSFIIK